MGNHEQLERAVFAQRADAKIKQLFQSGLRQYGADQH